MILMELIIETLGISEMELRYMMNLASPEGGQEDYFRELREIWDKADRSNEWGINQFYKGNLLYSAEMFHKIPFDHEVSTALFWADPFIINAFQNIEPGYVLVYGSGIGNEGFAIRGMGHHVTLYDIDAPHTEISKKILAALDDKDIRFNPSPFRYRYDVILTNQVMEHLYDPIGILKHFYECLFQDGILIMDYFFGNGNGRLPWHLESNQIFCDNQYWQKCIQSVGFHKIGDRLWQK